MLRELSIFVVAVLLSACSSNERTIDQSAADLRAMIQANDEALSLTHYLPRSGHRTEHVADGLIWHFTLDDKDYARMIISLKPKGAQSTSVSSTFEAVDDATGKHGIAFLRRTAEMASAEVLAATLEGRRVDRELLQSQLASLAAKDSALVAQAYTESTSQLFNEVQESGGAFAESSDKPVRSSEPYDQKLP